MYPLPSFSLLCSLVFFWLTGQDHPVHPREAARAAGHRPQRRRAALGGGEAAPGLLHQLALHGHAQGAPGAGETRTVFLPACFYNTYMALFCAVCVASVFSGYTRIVLTETTSLPLFLVYTFLGETFCLLFFFSPLRSRRFTSACRQQRRDRQALSYIRCERQIVLPHLCVSCLSLARSLALPSPNTDGRLLWCVPHAVLLVVLRW